jgi:ornithine decarboxylase
MRPTIEKLLLAEETPIMIIKKAALEAQYNLFKKHLPRLRPFFAIKANPHPEIIETFARLGAGVDAASATEIEWALSAGVSAQDIIFANTIKASKDLQFAASKNIALMTFDNEDELQKIAKDSPKANVVLRIKVANVGSVVELSLKFGAEPDQAVSLLQKATELGLKPAGLSFHVGSQCTHVDSFIQALEVSHSLFEQAAHQGIALKLLDIGGGFPIKHFENDEHLTFEELAGILSKELDRLFPADIEIIAEPGRFFVGPAGVLVTQVIGKSFRDNKHYYYLNDGVYQDFSGIVFDHCKYEYKTFKTGKKHLSALSGPTCDSFDTISLSEELPALDIGDIVYVENIGAYSSASAATAFNGIAPAKVIII